MSYEVLIDDNAHYRDESERRKHGEYASYDEALAAARSIVDDFLLEHCDRYGEASTLFSAYCQYGDDPFIVPDPGAGTDCNQERFSARNYARHRSRELFAESAESKGDR